MINRKTVLAIIPARGGSKGVPRKNVTLLAGKPLISWTIEEAKESKYIDRIIVSTDDPEIAKVALEWGADVPFMRPPEFARDDTPGIAPVLHALEILPQQYDLVILLQPTSPLRACHDIDACIERLLETGAKSCVSVVEPEKSPFWMYRFNGNHIVPLFDEKFDRRQDLPKTYSLNGAIYIAECRWLRSTKTFLADSTIGYIMTKQSSLDIDTKDDFNLAEKELQKLHRR